MECRDLSARFHRAAVRTRVRPMRLGARLANLVISDIRSMSRACDAVSGINLGQGICDLPTPPPVAKAAIDAITSNKVVYTAPEGIAPLRAAIAKKIDQRYGL